MGMGGAYQDAFEKEQKRKSQIKAEALAAEGAAVYNLELIRKLERKVGKLDLRLERLERDNALLTRLVERVGQTFNWNELEHGKVSRYPFTLIGQAEHDAAMHEAEGPPVTRESEGAWGYE